MDDMVRTNLIVRGDMINLSNILSYYYKADNIDDLVEFLKSNFNLAKKWRNY